MFSWAMKTDKGHRGQRPWGDLNSYSSPVLGVSPGPVSPLCWEGLAALEEGPAFTLLVSLNPSRVQFSHSPQTPHLHPQLALQLPEKREPWEENPQRSLAVPTSTWALARGCRSPLSSLSTWLGFSPTLQPYLASCLHTWRLHRCLAYCTDPDCLGRATPAPSQRFVPQAWVSMPPLPDRFHVTPAGVLPTQLLLPHLLMNE